MAAPFRQTFKLFSVSRFSDCCLKSLPVKHGLSRSGLSIPQRQYSGSKKSFNPFTKKNGLRETVCLVVGASASLYVTSKIFSHFNQPLAAESVKPGNENTSITKSTEETIDIPSLGISKFKRPRIKPSREVRSETDHSGLKLTLYQFQTCPFCCKVRAVLDYHGFSYDVIEVNSVTKKQIKWSDYTKVPQLVVERPGCPEVVLKDSSVIISILESYLYDNSTSIDKLNTYFPCIQDTSGSKPEFPNRYFIMFQERKDMGSTPKEREEERKWRRWADEHLVHMLSPNVYRTMSEALQAFNYFSEVGEWEKNFSTIERYLVIYAGAFVMYFIGWMLKHKYKLKDDVRESLYDACNEWVKIIGNKRYFLGGDQPNLADLSVYGILNSIEGCGAFEEVLQNTKISNWYWRTKEAVANHQGSHPLNSKAVPSNLFKK